MSSYEYKVEYGTPPLISNDGVRWVTHSTVSAKIQREALRAARADARALRKWHLRVRITFYGQTVC